jgi:hypothetical protein
MRFVWIHIEVLWSIGLKWISLSFYISLKPSAVPLGLLFVFFWDFWRDWLVAVVDKHFGRWLLETEHLVCLTKEEAIFVADRTELIRLYSCQNHPKSICHYGGLSPKSWVPIICLTIGWNQKNIYRNPFHFGSKRWQRDLRLGKVRRRTSKSSPQVLEPRGCHDQIWLCNIPKKLNSIRFFIHVL